MWQCIARDLVGEVSWVTIQTLYRDCSQLKDKRQGGALCRDTMHRQAHDMASGAQQGLRHGAGEQDTARSRVRAAIRPCRLRHDRAARP